LSATPQWSSATKRIVLIACIILIGLAIWRFSIVLAPLAVAVIIAYLLNPPVNWLTRCTPLRRGLAATIVYIVFLFVLALIPTLGAPILVRQISALDVNVQVIANQITEAMDYQFTVGDVNVNLSSLIEPVIGSLDQALSPLASWTANLAVDIAGGFIWAIFIFVVGFYLLLDANRFSDWVDSWVPPNFLEEFKQLRREIDGVWKAYFIGQLTLALIVGIIIGVSTALLGIRTAVLLGIVAALLELIPNWGYSISGFIGVIFAYFQGSTWLPLPHWAFALLVAVFYFVMWQIDTNYLVPRIIGHRLRLSPAIIIVGIIAGASVGGAVGLLLAAPTIATVRVLGSYLYRRLLDLEPYVLSQAPRPRVKPPVVKRQQVAVSNQPKAES
jgi:predicted PurR-regulated permease PerM